jgi:hypothetical protein
VHVRFPDFVSCCGGATNDGGAVAVAFWNAARVSLHWTHFPHRGIPAIHHSVIGSKALLHNKQCIEKKIKRFERLSYTRPSCVAAVLPPHTAQFVPPCGIAFLFDVYIEQFT